MNRLEAAKRKRLRRGAANLVRATNKIPAVDGKILVLATSSHAVRRRARKLLKRPDITVTFADAMAAVPASWTGRVQIELQPGTYHVPGKTAR
jgi:hypothetical protein